MSLDITADNTCYRVSTQQSTLSSEDGLTSESAHEIIDLTGRGTSHSVRNTHTVDASPIDSTVKIKEIHQVT